MNYKQLLLGGLSFIPGIPERMYLGTGGTDSALYCYGTWMRHIALASQMGLCPDLDHVVELGPGDSVGTGVAALLSGADAYTALDTLDHTDPERTRHICTGLVELFRECPPFDIGGGQFNQVPQFMIDAARRRNSIDPEKFAQQVSAASIARINGVTSTMLQWKVGGTQGPPTHAFSNAVMEHVEDIDSVNRMLFLLLAPGAVATHQIDFRSHGLFKAWDGHWTCPKWLWMLMRGRRGYLLNRHGLSYQLASMRNAGFEIVAVLEQRRMPEARGMRLSSLTDDDISICGAFVVVRKPML